jgi:hypothetical protein
MHKPMCGRDNEKQAINLGRGKIPIEVHQAKVWAFGSRVPSICGVDNSLLGAGNLGCKGQCPCVRNACSVLAVRRGVAFSGARAPFVVFEGDNGRLLQGKLKFDAFSQEALLLCLQIMRTPEV